MRRCSMPLSSIPVVCLVGFLSMIYAIVHKPKVNGDNNIEETKVDGDVEA
jgi:hypothetical protein